VAAEPEQKLIEIDSCKPSMSKEFFVDWAIAETSFILKRIDARWPTIANPFAAKET
jgi:hypothetical protein